MKVINTSVSQAVVNYDLGLISEHGLVLTYPTIKISLIVNKGEKYRLFKSEQYICDTYKESINEINESYKLIDHAFIDNLTNQVIQGRL